MPPFQLAFDGSGGAAGPLPRPLASSPYCLPTQPCFPSVATWTAFNDSLDGLLIRPEPLPCIEPECSQASWRIEQPGGVQFLNFETGEGLSPLTDDSATALSVEDAAERARGRTPAYVVDAQSAEDVAKAVNFSREHNLRLRIKNTGHDYLGRSSDVGSFTIWTHHLKTIHYNSAFVPEGAPEGTEPHAAILAGAGNTVSDMNVAADEAGVIVTGGVSKTVGAAGGFVLGGGHGPFAPSHGLAADNVLEFNVVTANGTIFRTSPFQHPSLFIALRGGGSSYAVVVETVYKAFAPPEGFIGIFGEFEVAANASKEEGDQAWRKLLGEWVELQPKLSAAGPFAGYTYVVRPFSLLTPKPCCRAHLAACPVQQRPQGTPFAYILPSPDVELAKSLFMPFFESAATDPIGINLLLGSRLIPKAVVEQKPADLAAFLAEAQSPSIVHLGESRALPRQVNWCGRLITRLMWQSVRGTVAGGAVEQDPEFPSSVNPAWRSALLCVFSFSEPLPSGRVPSPALPFTANTPPLSLFVNRHIDLPISWPANAPNASIPPLTAYLTAHTLALGSIASSLGAPQASYSSESDYNEEAWQSVWYGEENYHRLLEAKREWDPEGVFTARKAVGSEVVGW
ncbi:SPOSA6832_03737 [Sporobolomyces salmonicolor]|uniref:SPOSA6832_03737-mRNA-1:cds n=1 Tax=Sporidiobolus salmonicolor TaxID=5005 RepID=A0A0D6EPU4_SPOSA|nr:SPOSA6832_03737 [Sporobolomyces salmonicolor]